MGIKVRDKGLRPDQAQQASALLERLATESLRILTPTRADYALATRYLGQYSLGLRAGDALHLAVARNSGARVAYSLDRRFIQAGRKLKIKTEKPV
jgi:hypothetical protein